ncbi:MAG: hypothetical protein MN733_34285 [Nitrososphaera sp.]|nr:hypothetical protein [Nitrososphaera sp.]
MKKIGISAPEMSTGHWRIFSALGRIFDVRFEHRNFGDTEGVDAWIFPQVDKKLAFDIQNNDRPTYAVISRDHLVPCGESSAINFARRLPVPEVLMGRVTRSDEAIRLKGLPQWLQTVTPLAFKDEIPIWAVQSHRGCHHHYVALSIPELGEDEPLYQHLHGDQFLALLPLLMFLRDLTDDWRWQPPPLQACFMFDDPNLHWPTYGFINFAEIAKHADFENYHVSFATIPLDAWFVHGPTAVLFKKHRDRISLLMHGNDHVSEELARQIPNKERVRMLKQALYRIEKLEQRSGVAVSRVMAPPHGACSEETLAQMALMGYEAACISRGSLRHYNSRTDWVRALGMRPSETIRGLPVFPRFRISMNCQNSILVAVLLRQPIIPVGHHKDVAENLDLLAHLSRFINSLGDVRWTNMTSIARSHYSQMVDGHVLHLKMHSKMVAVSVPDGINQISVQRPWLEDEMHEPLLLNIMDKDANLISKDIKMSIVVHPGQRVHITSGGVLKYPNGHYSQAKFNPWPSLRRLFTESRDRLAPKLGRLSTRSTSS